MTDEKTTDNQMRIVALETLMKAHVESCRDAQKRSEKMFSKLFDTVKELQKVIWIGLGVLATLQFMIPMIKYFVTLMGDP